MAMKAAIVLLACVLAAAAVAQPTTRILPQTRNLSLIQLDRAEAMGRYGHPNEMWRYRALRALKLEQRGTRAGRLPPRRQLRGQVLAACAVTDALARRRRRRGPRTGLCLG
jgi:hypothetical protein